MIVRLPSTRLFADIIVCDRSTGEFKDNSRMLRLVTILDNESRRSLPRRFVTYEFTKYTVARDKFSSDKILL